MSIKNKKARTSNAYRLKKIEDHLIAEGYVCTSYIDGKKTGEQRWIDCIEGGYDISYDAGLPEIPEYCGTTPFCHDPRWKSLSGQFFHVHVEHGASGSAASVENAIRKSRRDLKASGESAWISAGR